MFQWGPQQPLFDALSPGSQGKAVAMTKARIESLRSNFFLGGLEPNGTVPADTGRGDVLMYP